MKYLIPAFLWALVILWLCAIPGQDLPDWTLLSFDKAGHAGIFFILTALLIWGFFKQRSDTFFRKYLVLISFLLALIYGGSTELMQQYWFENRTADPMDFLANSIGATVAVVLYYLLSKNKFFPKA